VKAIAISITVIQGQEKKLFFSFSIISKGKFTTVVNNSYQFWLVERTTKNIEKKVY